MSGTALSLGQFAEFSAAVLKALPRDMNPSDALAWARNGEKLERVLQSALCPLATPVPATEPIVLSVDYSQTLEQMIAAGHYDWKNDNITAKKFPVVGNGIVQFEAKVFHFDRDTSSQDNVDAIKAADPANPWEPAKTEHLLAFGAKYPEEQRKYPIVALGSVAEVDGDRRVPYLYRFGAGRRLDLGWWGIGWGGFCRFLAVRKLSSAAVA